MNIAVADNRQVEIVCMSVSTVLYIVHACLMVAAMDMKKKGRWSEKWYHVPASNVGVGQLPWNAAVR